MDVQLQELIDKIKNDGVSSAEKQAAEIVSEAEEKAQRIVAEAKKQAEAILDEAREKAVKTERAGKDALEQAARDLLLSVEKKLVALFSSVVQKETASSMAPDTLGELIVTVVQGWRRDPGAELEVLVPQETLGQVEGYLHDRLSEELKSGVTISASPHVETGFRVAVDGGSAYYDFTAEAIAAALAAYLNPRVTEIMRNAVS